MAAIVAEASDCQHFTRRGSFQWRHRQHITDLPPVVAQLKARLQKTQPRYFGFSLAEFRKVSTPPVQIPSEYRLSTASTTFVGGICVPLTRLMWLRRQREHPPTLSRIDECDESVWMD